MDKKREEEFEKIFRDHLQKQLNRGIKIGVLTNSRIVLDKLNDTSKSLEDRIEDVKKFCQVPLDNKEKFLDQDENNGISDKNE